MQRIILLGHTLFPCVVQRHPLPNAFGGGFRRRICFFGGGFQKSAAESAAVCNRRWIGLFGGGFGGGSVISAVDSAMDFAFGGGLRNPLLKRAVDGPLGSHGRTDGRTDRGQGTACEHLQKKSQSPEGSKTRCRFKMSRQQTWQPDAEAKIPEPRKCN